MRKGQILPDKDDLEREYLAGASFDSLAAKYGVRRKTVYNTMKLRAQKAGTRWPLKQGTMSEQALRRRAQRQRHDSITTVMIKAELVEFAEQPYAIPVREIARRAGVHPTTISQIRTGARDRCARSTAEAIMAVIEEVEKAGRRREQALHALNARRRKIAAEKAAGIRPPSQMDLIRARRSAA